MLALLLAASFLTGLALRTPLQQHFARIARAHFLLVAFCLSFTSGLAFEFDMQAATGLLILLLTQLLLVEGLARYWRTHEQGAILSFIAFGNPGIWTVSVAAVTLGGEAAAFIVIYDMLFALRVIPSHRRLRARAPIPQSASSALIDYAPPVLATTGLLLNLILERQQWAADAVAVFGIGGAVMGFIVFALALTTTPPGRMHVRTIGKALLLHFLCFPLILGVLAVLGIAFPPVLWIIALGPVPFATLTFARLYGYDTQIATSLVVASLIVATLLTPLALLLAGAL